LVTKQKEETKGAKPVSRESILAEFREIIKGPQNKYIEEWKREGKGVMGHFCSYVPLELFTAMGILPVRIRGAGSTDSGPADAYLSPRLCTFVRHATALALDEHYDFLDGEVSLNTCDHVRRANDVWRLKTNIQFHGFLSVPRNVRESLFPWFVEEVEILKKQMEEHFKVEVTEEALEDAIRLHNEVRRRLITLNQLRRRDPSPISGADTLAVFVASQLMPRDKFLPIVDELIAAVKSHEPTEKPRARVLLIGGELDEPEFVEVVEGQGAQVVGDNVCFGPRYSNQLIPEAGDPFEATYRNYFFTVDCARMVGGFPRRFEQIERLIRECNADGVIFQKMKFCDPWGSDQAKTMNRFKHMGRPLLVLEREYGVTMSGQVKTRTQAFLEALGK